MNSNIYFLFVWLETILFSSTEITYFSSQLSFYLANIKSKIWQLYVIWRHHCQSTRGSYLPLLIFSYKGISILYYSMTKSNFRVYASSTSSSIERKCPCMKKFKGEGNFPSYFDNDDVILHIIAKFRIWYWPRRMIVVRKNQLFLYC